MRTVSDVTDSPIYQDSLVELIEYAGFPVDLHLDYEGGFYYIYVEYSGRKRQLFTQRDKPRRFKAILRALDWGKRLGLRSASMYLEYSKYQEASSDSHED